MNFQVPTTVIGGVRLRLLVLVLAFAAFAGLAGAAPHKAEACVPAAFAPLPFSTFEGADGDQCDSDRVPGPPIVDGPLRDWQSIANDPGLVSTADAPSNTDTIYGSNNAGLVGGATDENKPDSWNFTTGNLGAEKFDALAASSFTDPGQGNKLFLDLSFVRAASTGATFFGFELNQKQPGYRLDPNEADAAAPYKVPTRSDGDLLVTYDINNAGAISLGLCSWDGDEHAGRWEEFSPTLSGAPVTNEPCPPLTNGLYQAALNDGQGGREGAIPASENYLAPGGAIAQGRFGEAVANLTDALKDPAIVNGPQPCIDFGYVWLHSRSSNEISSNQQDFILPSGAVSIGNCSVEGKKFEDTNGDGSRQGAEPYLGGWTIWVDYDNDGLLDNNKDATFVNDMDGLVEAGEEEPYDVTADGTGTEPLGSYRITKVQTSSSSTLASATNPVAKWRVREELKSAYECTAAVGAGNVTAPDVCPEKTDTNARQRARFRALMAQQRRLHRPRFRQQEAAVAAEGHQEGGHRRWRYGDCGELVPAREGWRRRRRMEPAAGQRER